VIYDYYSGKYIRGYRARDSHHLNVFSKLLVFCAVNTLLEKHKVDSSRFETIATEGVLKMHKGDCLLRPDDILSLEDLLHLMIMEEAEVYETILAVNVGAYLEKKRQKEYYSVFDANDRSMKQQLKHFYEMVNSYCKLLKLDNIHYVESEPLARREKNKCSACDVAVLSIECLKIPLFSEMLRKLHHTATVKFIDGDGKLAQRELIIHSRAILNKFIPYFSVCRNWEENNFMDSHCSIFYENHQ
jgi:D-alanyl-D-alanine carboxypeptidase